MPIQTQKGGKFIDPKHPQPSNRRELVVRTTLRPLHPREGPDTIVQEAGYVSVPVWTARTKRGVYVMLGKKRD